MKAILPHKSDDAGWQLRLALAAWCAWWFAPITSLRLRPGDSRVRPAKSRVTGCETCSRQPSRSSRSPQRFASPGRVGTFFFSERAASAVSGNVLLKIRTMCGSNRRSDPSASRVLRNTPTLIRLGRDKFPRTKKPRRCAEKKRSC